MKIIIGWSGRRSRKLAILLQEWLKRVIQAADSHIIKIDDNGREFPGSEVIGDANDCFGILCLTKDNHQDHNILFEAGVLSTKLPEDRLSAVLLNIDEESISLPLRHLSLSTTGKDDIWKLVRSLNDRMGAYKLKRDLLEDSFNTFWGRFEKEVDRIIRMPADADDTESVKERSTTFSSEPVLIELLATVRSLESRFLATGHEQPSVEEVSDRKEKPFQDSIESLIHTMSKSSYSESSIIDFLKKIGIPESYARFTVHKTLGTGVHVELHRKSL